MNDNYDDVPVATSESLARRAQEGMTASAAPGGAGGLATTDQARAVGEIQAALTVAMANPRNEYEALTRIKNACKRLAFAEKAEYAYKRGGSLIQDLSIRAAEMLATRWKHISYGYRVVKRAADGADCEAYAWDLETNTLVRRGFFVRHGRDKGGKLVEVTQERDKYEVEASAAQRRVRACILAVIPEDILDEARATIRRTIQQGDGKGSFEDRVRALVEAFGALGVTVDMLEGFLQHPLSALAPAELPRLRQIYNSVNSGVAKREEFFSVSGGSGRMIPPEKKPDADEATKGGPDQTVKTRRKRGRPKKQKTEEVESPPPVTIDNETGEVTEGGDWGDPGELTPEEKAELEAAEKQSQLDV